MRLRPDVDGVVLRVRTRPTLEADDPPRHARLVQILAQECLLVVGLAPPANDLRRPQPALQEGHVLRHDGSECVRAHAISLHAGATRGIVRTSTRPAIKPTAASAAMAQ